MKKLTHRTLSLALPLLLPVFLPACNAAPKTAPKPAPQAIKKQPVAKEPATRAASLTLVQNGASAYVIALAGDAIPGERTAANELSDYLQKISGAKLAVKSEDEVGADEPQILVGAGSRVKELLPGQKWEALRNDGIVIKTAGRDLILAGGRPRGSLYAVYSFLEDTLGVRWWTRTENEIPAKTTLVIAPQNTVYTPQLRTREAFYESVRNDPGFATRLKINGHFQSQGPELGGHNSNLGWCHTFDQLLPVDKYFKAHPEWYSDPNNGGKPCTTASAPPTHWTTQLCLSNDAARLELTKNALALIAKNPDAGMISISQNDNSNPCTCAADMALQKAEGSPAGPLLHFVNLVAADIEKQYPNFQVETLAYQYTRKPPLHERPRHNVVIRLCSDGVNVARPLNSDANATYRDNYKAWQAIAPLLDGWEYTANFGNVIMPLPNLQVMTPNIRFYAANNMIGLFEQGDSYSEGTGDFVQLRTWLLAHMMWNPALDQPKLQDEFMRGYYGAAAPSLQAYLNLIESSFMKTGQQLTAYQTDYSYLTLDVMNQATALFATAEKSVAGDKVLAPRVRRARLPLDHAWILRYKDLRAAATSSGQEFAGPKEILPYIDDFIATAKAFGVNNISEHERFASYAARLRARFAPPAPLPAILRDKLPAGSQANVMDVQEDQFHFYGEGTNGSLIDDPAASNGRAGKIRGDILDWAMQYPFTDLETGQGQSYHCYLVARVDAAPGASPTNPAFSCGIYGHKDGKGLDVAKATKTVADLKNGYAVIDLGAHVLATDAFVWVAPVKNPQVPAIYIDRLIVIPEKN